ncbi:MAG TPA: hypothetical protein PLZ45_07705 [Ferruginibacter sp.]|nr:hypothetical protein [Ferruginibacter sp.]
MLHLVRQFLTSISLVFFLFLVTGCNNGEKAVKEEYNNYQFDPQVINHLPLYDSLVFAIKENFSAFEKFIKDGDSYRSFRYIPAATDPDAFIKLPPAAEPKITPYYTRIGKDLIYGFDLFKDSSVKIYVKKRYASASQVDIVEYLSYYSSGNIRDRVFPEKDSTLNKSWQYWVRFDRRGLF